MKVYEDDGIIIETVEDWDFKIVEVVTNDPLFTIDQVRFNYELLDRDPKADDSDDVP